MSDETLTITLELGEKELHYIFVAIWNLRCDMVSRGNAEEEKAVHEITNKLTRSETLAREWAN